MASKQIRISITSALNAAGIEATKKQVRSMSDSVSKDLAKMSRENHGKWADIKAVWELGCAAIKKAWKTVTAGLKAAFKFETQTTQFKTLIGDIDAAKAHMQMLKELGDTPPFGIDQFAAASREMLVMTDGVLGFKSSLEMVGDAAAATGKPIEQVGHAVGRLFATIRDGQPISRAVMELRNMGIVTPEVCAKLQDMQDAGESSVAMWAEVERQLARYGGAMAETEKTGEGLIGAIQSRWDNVVRQLGIAFEDSAKGGMSEVLAKAKELEDSGSVESWARGVSEWLGKCVEGAVAFSGLVGKILSYPWKAVTSTFESISQAIGGAVGAIQGGGGIGDAMSAAWAGWESGSNDVWDWDGAQKAHDEELKAIAKEKKARAKAEEEQRMADEQSRKRIALETAEYERAVKERDDIERKAAEQMKEDAERMDKELSARKKRDDEAAQRDYERILRQFTEKRIKSIQSANKAELDALDEQIAKTEELAKKWDERSNGARGKNAGEFAKDERDRRRNESREADNLKKRTKSAADELARLEKIKNPSKQVGDKIASLRQFLEFQGDNPHEKRVRELEKQKAESEKKMQGDVERIRNALENKLGV